MSSGLTAGMERDDYVKLIERGSCNLLEYSVVQIIKYSSYLVWTCKNTNEESSPYCKQAHAHRCKHNIKHHYRVPGVNQLTPSIRIQ